MLLKDGELLNNGSVSDCPNKDYKAWSLCRAHIDTQAYPKQMQEAWDLLEAHAFKVHNLAWAEVFRFYKNKFLGKRGLPLDEDGFEDINSVRGKSILLTWINKEWTLNLELNDNATIQQVVKAAEQHPDVDKLWAVLEKDTERFMNVLNAKSEAHCLEVCPDTWERRRVVQLHVHFGAVARGKRLKLCSVDHLTLLGHVPQVSQDSCVMGVGYGQRNKSTPYMALYYIQCGKNTAVRSGGNAKPYKDYAVNPEWIQKLYAQDKISAATAHQNWTLCGKNVKHYHDNLTYRERELQELKAKSKRDQVAAELRLKVCARKRYPEIDDLFAYALDEDLFEDAHLDGIWRLLV